MHQLIINQLGPIRHCELDIRNTTILTGYQASGKSTIAKAVYFFRSLKEDLLQLVLRRAAESNGPWRLTTDFEMMVRNKFLNTFGSSYSMDADMTLQYTYAYDTKINILLKDDPLSPNYVWVEYSTNIRQFLASLSLADIKRDELQKTLNTLFDDSYETVYIPAGRSILTLLSGQLNYIYSTMDDMQKRLLDACTRDYIERVIRLRPQFSTGLKGLTEGLLISADRQKLLDEAQQLIHQILKGNYSVVDGEERILIGPSRYVKINYASSGQQESVWIMNLLYYALALNQKTCFIIEEPESNLFPESQKLMVEFIALVVNAGNSVLLTTHSPYVLGAINNLLYADVVRQVADEKIEAVIPRSRWLHAADCDARFVADGYANSCIDSELQQIDNSLMDEISHVINVEYDRLFEIETEAKGDQPCR